MEYFWVFSSGVVFLVMLQNVTKVVLLWAVTKIIYTYSPGCTISKPVPLELACPKTWLYGVSIHFEHFFLVKTEFIFFHCISYLEAIFVPKNAQSCFFTMKNCLKSPESPCIEVFGACQLQWWWLEVCHQRQQYVCHVFSYAISPLAFLFKMGNLLQAHFVLYIGWRWKREALQRKDTTTGIKGWTIC